MNDLDRCETHARPVLACLGVASRFRLVRALAVADRCVGELAAAVGLSQSCTTRHLQALERVGLVQGCREGRRVRFSLRADAPGLAELLGWALSEAGPEALDAAGGILRRERTAGSGPRHDIADAAPARQELEGASGPEDTGPVPPAGSTPTRRSDELEDYLL